MVYYDVALLIGTKATQMKVASGPYAGELVGQCNELTGLMRLPGVTLTTEEAANIRARHNLSPDQFYLDADGFPGTYCIAYKNPTMNRVFVNQFKCSDVGDWGYGWFWGKCHTIKEDMEPFLPPESHTVRWTILGGLGVFGTWLLFGGPAQTLYPRVEPFVKTVADFIARFGSLAGIAGLLAGASTTVVGWVGAIAALGAGAALTISAAIGGVAGVVIDYGTSLIRDDGRTISDMLADWWAGTNPNRGRPAQERGPGWRFIPDEELPEAARPTKK